MEDAECLFDMIGFLEIFDMVWYLFIYFTSDEVSLHAFVFLLEFLSHRRVNVEFVGSFILHQMG